MTVTLPLILPAIAAAWMLAFALSLDDLVIASFTTGPGATTLPIRIYSEVRLGVSPEMNAVCSIMVGVVGLAVIAASLLTKLSGARGARRGTERKHDRMRELQPINPALAGRPENVEQKPDRHDDQRSQQQIGQCPGKAGARQVLDPFGREPVSLTSCSGPMPKCVRIVPTIIDAISTLTTVRVRPSIGSFSAQVAATAALIRARKS